MKATLVFGAFLAAVLIASPLLAKQGDPITGIVIGLEHEPGGVVVSQTKTNSAGVAVFPKMKPGKYRITIGIIDWGDGSPTRVSADQTAGGNRSGGAVSADQALGGRSGDGRSGVSADQAAGGGLSKTAVRSAVIEITVPGQAKIADNESPRPDDRSMKTADQRLVPFTVTGNGVRTVTVTLTQGSESK
jgi:hypothetical protein